MCVNAEETHGVVNDEVSGSATGRSHRATNSFPGLPIARAALKFASARHASQYRETDHTPFITHPIEVGSLLHWDRQPDEVIAAGLLHDVLEKTGTTRAELQRRFGACVAGLVESVSDDPSIDDYESRKRELRDRVAPAGSNTVAIFAADKISKVRELALLPTARLDETTTRAKLAITGRASRYSAELPGTAPSSIFSTPSSTVCRASRSPGLTPTAQLQASHARSGASRELAQSEPVRTRLRRGSR